MFTANRRRMIRKGQKILDCEGTYWRNPLHGSVMMELEKKLSTRCSGSVPLEYDFGTAE